MTALFDSRFLNSARIQTIIETRASEYARMRPMTFLDRLSLVNADDDEITGRFTSRLLTADIIADNQPALVYEGGQVELFTNQIPNIKIGQNVSQSQLNVMERLRNGQGRAVEEDALFDWEQRFAEFLLEAVYERMNMLACAMMLDDLTYSRFGVQFASLSWGMPANLKLTPSTPWTTAASATPLDDIQTFDQVDADNYGYGPFDRMTMSREAFRYMTATTQFYTRVSMVAGVNFALGAGMLSTKDDPSMLNFAQTVLGKEIVLDDRTYREQQNDGTYVSRRVLPANKVILDRKANGPREWDFANAVVTESIVAGLLSGVTLGTNPRMEQGGAYGPLGYYTAQSPDLNPPGVNAFAVCRGFPRRHQLECSAVLTVF